MDAYQEVALDEYLCAYPNDKTYEEVLDLLLLKDDEVVVWEAFEGYKPIQIVGFIGVLHTRLEAVFVPRNKEECE